MPMNVRRIQTPEAAAPTAGQSAADAQPIGIFGYPAGLLLWPADADPTVVADVLRGRLPQTWPTELRGHEAAHAGQVQAALAAFDGADVVSRWNRYVLDPSEADARALRRDLPEDLSSLVDVVRFTIGEIHDAPDVATTSSAPRPEVEALIVAAQATQALQHDDIDQAVAMLHVAAATARPVSPVLAALLQGNAGAIAADRSQAPAARTTAIADLQGALAVLDETDLALNAAEFHLSLGSLEHERAAAADEPAREAMHHYHATLQLVGEHESPLLWANAQLNLACAYLAAPMTQASDQLRHGIAVGSLRASLRVFTPQEHPEQWAGATLNLANALVYAPSTHPRDNLLEAVDLYEQVVAVRPRHVDPLGRARVLTNLGNALAHLGALEPATQSLMEARSLFEQHLDHDSAFAVRSILDEIARQGVHAEQAPGDGLSDRSTRQVHKMVQLGAMSRRDEVATGGQS